MLIDTHAHVNFVAFKEDGDVVVERALKNNIWIINSGSQWETSRRAVEYAKKYKEGIFASVALHPIHLASRAVHESLDEQELLDFETKEEKFDYDYYKNLALDEKTVAIGETGLDYYHLGQENREAQIELQKEIFLRHLELARQVGKPVVIHCREAHSDILAILSGWDITGMIHSFSGRWSQAQEYLKKGFYLGFNGIITFARDYDKVIKNMPLERLVLETDCPYLAPVPFRGKRNEPLYVKYVAEKIAQIKNISFEGVASATTENAKRLFNI